jgi:hypothetical protein
VCEEKSFGLEDVAASAVVNLISVASVDAFAEKSSTPAASPADVDEDPGSEDGEGQLRQR